MEKAYSKGCEGNAQTHFIIQIPSPQETLTSETLPPSHKGFEHECLTSSGIPGCGVLSENIAASQKSREKSVSIFSVLFSSKNFS